MTTSPRWRVALVSAASAAVLVAGPLAGAQPAHAQAYPPPPPTLTLPSSTLVEGVPIPFSAQGFGPDQEVTAALLPPGIYLGSFTTNGQGSVSGTVVIPTAVTPGVYTFQLKTGDPLTASATVTVVRRREKPGHPNRPHDHDHDHDRGHSRNSDDRPATSHGRGGTDLDAVHAEPARFEHRRSLAETGGEKAMALGGAAVGLLAAGTGTMMAVRRRRSS